MAARTRTQPVVLNYMHSHAGEVMHYMDISNGIGPEYSANAVGTCLARLVKDYPELGITRHGSGTYMFRVADQRDAKDPVVSAAIQAGDIFEVVVATKAGTVLLQNSVGKVYRLGEEV